MSPHFFGSIPALITPFRDGIVDEKTFISLVERQIVAGSHALAPNGTTGESVTLSVEEQKQIIAACIRTAAGRVPVIAGTGSNDTAKTIALTRFAKAEGADAALVVVPYYNRPHQDGIYAHFMAVADAVELPIFVYNVPARTVADILPETLARLAAHPNIVGIKDASNQLDRVARHRAACGPTFVLLSGEDATSVGFNALGGVGCISVTANVAPEFSARMHAACLAGDFGAAQDLNRKLSALHRALFLEPSPAPTKYALWRLGLCSEDVRLPLVPVSGATRSLIDAALTEAGLL
jgi:4-hydroxy-tetrahydrodipicolinate synthase